MNSNRIRTALGFAMRAGKCISGDFICEKAVKNGTALAVAVDEGASEATRERYTGMCQRAGIPCVFIEDLGRAIGKDNRMIAAVTEAGFARMITEAVEASK